VRKLPDVLLQPVVLFFQFADLFVQKLLGLDCVHRLQPEFFIPQARVHCVLVAHLDCVRRHQDRFLNLLGDRIRWLDLTGY
jgi:hypothetical protein